jgi:hypothetical protein
LCARTLMQQFHSNVLMCPNFMGNILYSLKNQKLGYDVDYDFLRTALKYLQSPILFIYDAGTCFEDIIVKEYYRKNEIVKNFICCYKFWVWVLLCLVEGFESLLVMHCFQNSSLSNFLLLSYYKSCRQCWTKYYVTLLASLLQL